jgi:hypothetical protein
MVSKQKPASNLWPKLVLERRRCTHLVLHWETGTTVVPRNLQGTSKPHLGRRFFVAFFCSWICDKNRKNRSETYQNKIHQALT